MRSYQTNLTSKLNEDINKLTLTLFQFFLSAIPYSILL